MKHLLPLLLLLISPLCHAQSLTREAAASAKDSILSAWRKQIVRTNGAEMNSGTLSIVHSGFPGMSSTPPDTIRMPFRVRLFGKRPNDGYPLYISMHGGGNAPKQVNDAQWQNQMTLYTPECGYYICPRAPWDDWNMWFRPGIDELYEKLITTLTAGGMINPNKVYIMGYSAGGDGVWRLAPRLADHWAAAAMMAGHPGESSVVNLVNTPLTIWCGALDAAYDRNTLCAQRGAQLDSLAKLSEPSCNNQLLPCGGRQGGGSYPHSTHIVPAVEHWMERADTAAVPWMAQYTRNPRPRHIIWRQEEVVRPRLYWLSVNPATARQGMTIEARLDANTITIDRCDYDSLTVWLNDQLLDLDKPVSVKQAGRTLYKGKAQRTVKAMEQSLALFTDPEYIYSARLDIKAAK